MKKTIVALAALVWSSLAQAQTTIPVVWEQPLLYENGTPMQHAEISHYELHYTIEGDFKESKEPVRVEGQMSHELKLNLKPRIAPYVVSVAVRTVDIYAKKSKMSNVIKESFGIASPAPPAAPVNIKISISCDETCKVVKTDVK